MARLASPNIRVYQDSIFDSVNIHQDYDNISQHGYSYSVPTYTTVEIELKFSNNFNSLEDIEDIVGNRWMLKKFGMSLQEFEERFPEITL